MNTIYLRHCLCLLSLIAFTLPSQVFPAQSSYPDEDQAIKNLLSRFYEGWNSRDVEKMVSVYAEDVDHINTYAEWNKGKTAIRDALRQFHAGPGKKIRKTYVIEKIRFIKPDVAVAQVRSLSTVGNIGTYVMTKESGQWLVVSFTNIEYKLGDR